MAEIDVNRVNLSSAMEWICEKHGIPHADAVLVTDSLVDAEIRGVESHGIVRLRGYLGRLKKGLINPRPDIKIEKLAGTISVVDGDHGLGQVVTMRALEACMENAKMEGMAVVFVKNSNHFGCAGYFSRKAAREGFVSLVTSNASKNMPPYGGMEALLGTNPVSVSFPAGKYQDFTLDIAMSAVAKGKIIIANRAGKSIPAGWAMDADGNDTTDPGIALAGAGLLPMAAHKGYGLAMVVDVFAGILSGATLSSDNESMFAAEKISGVGHYIFILDINRLMPLQSFISIVENWFDRIKASKTRPDVNEIFIPGEIGNRTNEKAAESIQVLDKTIEEIKNYAKETGYAGNVV